MTCIKLAPAQQRWNADKESVGPDEEDDEDGGEEGGEGELPVLGHHHEPL